MIRGTVNYLAETVTPSLHRTGRVATHRDRDGSDAGSVGVVVETREIEIIDARSLPDGERPTCEHSGFELCNAPTASDSLDYYDHSAVIGSYYAECADLVRHETGAEFVVAFDHNVRSAAGKAEQRRVAGGQEVQGPAHMVHGDYTLTSAPQRLDDLSRAPTGNDTLREVLAEGESLVPADLAREALDGGRRFAIINVWRSIGAGAVRSDAMALCDGRSVAPGDLVVFEIHYHDRIGENYFARPAETHRWYTYPGMTTDEVLLIKQWDSAGPLARTNGAAGDGAAVDEPCTFSFHTAYRDEPPEETTEAPARESIEVRCLVIYGSSAGGR